jgi:hypothetical protein
MSPFWKTILLKILEALFLKSKKKSKDKNAKDISRNDFGAGTNTDPQPPPTNLGPSK